LTTIPRNAIKAHDMGVQPRKAAFPLADPPLKALIVGAGQGKRLLPLTQTEPKALIRIGGRSLLEWQVAGLAANGVRDIVFIAGFNAQAVERALAALAAQYPACRFATVYNPFYSVADNLASCWMARAEMTDEFLLVNSDTLFSAPVLATLLASPAAPVTLAVDHKAQYDADDMKVELDGTRLLDVGKRLPEGRVNGESIGMLYFRGDAGRALVAALDAAMLEPAALKQWFLSVIAALARRIEVRACSISGHDWCEVDYPLDVQAAKQMVARWRAGDAPAMPLASRS
jgi:choline kinase